MNAKFNFILRSFVFLRCNNCHVLLPFRDRKLVWNIKVNTYTCRKCGMNYQIKFSFKRLFIYLTLLLGCGVFVINYYDPPFWVVGLLGILGVMISNDVKDG